MDRDRTLPDWTNLLLLLLKYFSSTSLNFGRGERNFFFFRGWPGYRYLTSLIRPLGLPGNLRRCTRQPRAYKFPILAHFILVSYFWKNIWSDLKLSWAVFSVLVYYFSFLCTWGQCLFFLLLLLSFFFFGKMLVATLLRMHACVYFIFLNFCKYIYIYCHDLCHVILGKCTFSLFLFLLYECVNIWVFKCWK